MFFLAAAHPALVQSAITAQDVPWKRDLVAFEAELAKREAAFPAEKVSGDTREGTKPLLAHLRDLDQFGRGYWNAPHVHGYAGTASEQSFRAAFQLRMRALDAKNLHIFKRLLDHWGWFDRRTWGAQADHDAWLLAQHADDDLPFQEHVLTLLEPLVKSGGTDPSGFAYLFDRVAVNAHRLQRFGTQGYCTGPGTWKPRPIEDPKHVDARRKTMGLEPLAGYIASFKGICHEDQTEQALKALPLPGK